MDSLPDIPPTAAKAIDAVAPTIGPDPRPSCGRCGRRFSSYQIPQNGPLIGQHLCAECYGDAERACLIDTERTRERNAQAIADGAAIGARREAKRRHVAAFVQASLELDPHPDAPTHTRICVFDAGRSVNLVSLRRAYIAWRGRTPEALDVPELSLAELIGWVRELVMPGNGQRVSDGRSGQLAGVALTRDAISGGSGQQATGNRQQGEGN